jgi:hypothetical protein
MGRNDMFEEHIIPRPSTREGQVSNHHKFGSDLEDQIC